MADELELKLTASPDFDPEALLQRLESRAEVRPRPDVPQRDVYWDTPAEDLRRAGLSARVRHRSDSRKIEVKPVPIVSGLVMSRAEIVRGLEPEDDAADEVARLARELGVVLHERPIPVCELRTDRKPYEVHRHETRAELAIDRVQVHRVGQSAADGFIEVELELEDGDPDEIHALAEVMNGEDLEPSQGSKYVRARAMLGLAPHAYGAPPHTFEPETPVDVVARGVCRRQLAVMHSYEPGTRVGLDTEHLHKMRVATRRFRTALRVFRAFLPEDERKDANAQMRWIGRKLGAVRDLDVHLLALPTWRRRFGPEPQDGWEALGHALRHRRHQARASLLEALDSERRQSFERRAALMFAQGQGEGPPVGDAAKSILHDVVERFQRGVTRFQRTHAAEDAHQLRILGKRLRYTAEFFRPLIDDATHDRIKRLSAFQDALGHLQDTVAAGELARELFEGGDAAASLVYVLGVLDGAARVSVEQARVRVDRALEELDPGVVLPELLAAVR